MVRIAKPCCLAALFALTLTGPLLAQQGKVTAEARKTDPNVIEIIKLAESKLYSPVRDGLKDLTFKQRLALKGQVRTFWFKGPDRVKGVFGDPEAVKNTKETAASRLFKNRKLLKKVPDVVARHQMSRFIGNPISFLLPYGFIEVVSKDENGTQLRFTIHTENPEDLIWNYVDFFLDKDFRLVKIMEKLLADGRIEEHRITLKPLKIPGKEKDAEAGPELMVVDRILTIASTPKWTKTVTSVFEYAPVGEFMLPKQIKRTLHETKEEFVETFYDVKANAGIEEKVFKDAK